MNSEGKLEKLLSPSDFPKNSEAKTEKCLPPSD